MADLPPPQPERSTDPQSALTQIQSKINSITKEYSAGKLNRTQFYAMYRHYMERRAIIQKLLERNPESDAWKAAAAPGSTTFLRDRYEARTLYWVTFKHGSQTPLSFDGKLPTNAAKQIHKMLQVIWKMKTARKGLARKSLGDGMWLLILMGDDAMTLVVYFLQPSTLQVNALRDLHNDFEQANATMLARNLSAKRMVFPQRALIDEQS